MLEKPAIPDAQIIACLRTDFDLNPARLTFLPIGADLNTVVYRAETPDGKTYFVKLRRGEFNAISVTLPHFLREQGVAAIIAPLPTDRGDLWTSLAEYHLTLYPFVEGRNGYEIQLSEGHWRAFGAAMQRVHTIALPPWLFDAIPREGFGSQWRLIVQRALEHITEKTWSLPVARRLADVLSEQRPVITDLLQRTEKLATRLQNQPPEFVLCHSDVHAGNILVDASHALYIVDWDAPILAPKERDLMYPGAGLFGQRRAAQEEESLFYQGYGPVQINPAALAYYRYERILEDIAVYCEQIFSATQDNDDLGQSLYYLESNFLPDNTIELALRSDTN